MIINKLLKKIIIVLNFVFLVVICYQSDSDVIVLKVDLVIVVI